MRNAVYVSILIFLAACTSVPRPAGHFWETEGKIQSSRHWRALAKEVVETQVLHRTGTAACGKPGHAPVTSTQSCRAISRPNSRAFLLARAGITPPEDPITPTCVFNDSSSQDRYRPAARRRRSVPRRGQTGYVIRRRSPKRAGRVSTL